MNQLTAMILAVEEEAADDPVADGDLEETSMDLSRLERLATCRVEVVQPLGNNDRDRDANEGPAKGILCIEAADFRVVDTRLQALGVNSATYGPSTGIEQYELSHSDPRFGTF